MKKLGIVTFNRATNYGALLQAYAMKQVCEQLGYETSVVDYALKPDGVSNPLRSFLRSKPSGRSAIRFLKQTLGYCWGKKRWLASRQFREKYLRETEPCAGDKDISDLGFDAYVMGSDQIWNYGITGKRFDPVFFGKLPGAARCVVYGASAHDAPFPLDRELQFQDMLKDISVPVGIREEKLADYAAMLSGVRYPVVLDPTLLAGKEALEAIESPRRYPGPYILIYQIDANPASDISIRTLEKRFGCRVYSMTVPKLGSTHGKMGQVGPEEFLSLLDHAEFLLTNSFHGVALSLLWHKQFFVYEHGGAMTRIDNLLDTVQLSDRKVRMVADIDPARTIDYDRVDRILEERRAGSLAFLRNALDGVDAAAPEERRERTETTPFSRREKDACSGCTACVEICPVGAIQMEPDQEGFRYPVIDAEKCVHCGRCDRFCSFVSEPHRNREELPRAYGIKHRDEKIREKSRSGGAFIAISDVILSQGGVVYGAALCPDHTVRHIRAESEQERDRMQGAKYVQSDMTGILKELMADLKEGRKVLFSGTPCQVAGVKHLLRFCHMDDADLVTCDLVCHGVPSPAVWADYVRSIQQKHGSPVVRASFRDKDFGWDSHYESFSLENGKKVVSRDYTDLFYAHLMFRPSCHQCRFSNVNRVADITLGDFWGIEKNDPSFEDRLGVSLVLVNTPRGKQVLEEAGKDLIAISCDLQNCIQPTLVRPSPPSPKREQFWESYQKNGFSETMKRFVRPDPAVRRIKRTAKQLLYQAGLRDRP